MFHAFAIDDGGLFAYTKPDQECFDNCVPLFCARGKALSLGSQRDWLVGSGFDQPVALQATNGVVDRCMRHVKVRDKVDRTAAAVFVNRVGDGLDIVLGNFAGVIRTGPVM